MGMKLHTVFITYNRLELTQQAIASYLATVDVPFSLWIVDNASTDGTQEWLLSTETPEHPLLTLYGYSLLEENRYPGYACNQGWLCAPADATHLHRADNDFAFLPGWRAEVARMFKTRPNLGQVGLRTDEEESFIVTNVGGNCVISREIWDKGIRYDETPWPEYPAGYSEDSYFSPVVKKMGYMWTRVKAPCIVSLASGDLTDPYYLQSYTDRNIVCEHGNIVFSCKLPHEKQE